MRNFYLLYSAQLISQTGSVLNSVISMFWIYGITGSVSRSILTGFFTAVVYLSVSLFASSIIDRDSKKKYVLLGEAAQMFVFLAFFLLAKYNIRNIYWIYALQGVIGLSNAFFYPAISAWQLGYIRHNYRKIVGNMHVISTSVNLLGILLGGFLSRHIAFQNIFLYNAISFGAALLIESFVPEEAVRAAGVKTARSFAKLLSEMGEGFKYVRREKPAVLSVILFLAVVNMFFAPLADMMPLLVKAGFGRGADSFSLLMLASICGALLAGIIVRKIKAPGNATIALFCGLNAGLSVFTSVTHSFYSLLGVMFLIGLANSLIGIAIKIEISGVKPEYFCKVQSVSENISGTLVPLGILLMACLSSRGGIRFPFLFSGLVILGLCAVYLAVLNRENLRRYFKISAEEGVV